MLHARHLVFAAFMVGASASAQQFAVGDMIVEHPWARATPKGSSVGAGYMILRNKGGAADILTAIASDVASAVEMHETKTRGGVTSMDAIPALTIPAGGSVAFRPGAYHVMFVGLKAPLKQGDHLRAMLTFEHAGTIAADFTIEAIGAAAPGGSMPSMPSMDMK
jgi:periplasmic copper chaperone A